MTSIGHLIRVTPPRGSLCCSRGSRRNSEPIRRHQQITPTIAVEVSDRTTPLIMSLKELAVFLRDITDMDLYSDGGEALVPRWARADGVLRYFTPATLAIAE